MFWIYAIPVPPLEEQNRIVAKIEEILPYIDQYDKAYTKLETFNKKIPRGYGEEYPANGYAG